MTTKTAKKAASKSSAKKAAIKKADENGFRFEVGGTTESMKASLLNHLRYTLARHPESATKDEWWTATCLAVRDRLLDRFMKTQEVHHKKKVRRAYYLSLEYLMGRLLINNLHSSGLYEPAREALEQLGQDFDLIAAGRADMGLGNGGLGRLAACFLDSLATLTCQRWAMAFTTSSACSARNSRTAIKSSTRTFGRKRAAPGKSCVPTLHRK